LITMTSTDNTKVGTYDVTVTVTLTRSTLSTVISGSQLFKLTISPCVLSDVSLTG
jgi:hypothetical protein